MLDWFDSFKSSILTTFSHGLLGIAFTAIICLIAAKYILKIANTIIDKSPLDETLSRFFKPVVRVIVYFVIILIIADKLGFNVNSLVAFASVLSAAFALAAQGMLSNLFGGILMLWTKPFIVGDYVIAGGVEGTVQQISLFNTVLDTIDNKRVIVPNGTISTSTITNCSSEGQRRVDMEISASYDAPLKAVKEAIYEAIETTENTLDATTAPADPFVRVLKYGDSAITYVVRIWAENAHYWDVYFDMMENVKEAFDRNHIEMTYNHLVIHNGDEKN